MGFETEMCTREDEIANEIKVEFCKRVIPSHMIRYLTCLTVQDKVCNTHSIKHKIQILNKRGPSWEGGS